MTNIRFGTNLSDYTQRHGRTKRAGGPQQTVQDRGLRHVQERQGHRADLRTEAEQGTRFICISELPVLSCENGITEHRKYKVHIYF